MKRIELEISLCTEATDEEILGKINEFCAQLAEFDPYLHVDAVDISGD